MAGLMGSPRIVGEAPDPEPDTPVSLLGAACLGWWHCDNAALITESSGLVSSWKDEVAAYDLTGSLAERPTYSATGWNSSAPGITFDGTANVLTLGSVPFPAGANASVIWAVVDQLALAADATARIIFGYGGDANTNQRRLYRSVTSGQNRPFALTGNGSSAPTASLAADFSGRHYVRGNFGGSSTLVNMDGTSSSSTTVTPATGTSRCRMGAIPNATASGFFNGVIREVFVTSGLTAEQVTAVNAYCAARAA